MTLLKVSSRSNPHAVAGAFAGVVREQGSAEVCVIGAGALNQAIKAIAIARTFLADQGIDLVCVPSFCDVEIDTVRRTGIRLLVERRAVERPDVGHREEVDDLQVEVRLDDLSVDQRGDAGPEGSSPAGADRGTTTGPEGSPAGGR